MDLPRRLGLAVLAGLDADGVAGIRATIADLANSHPAGGLTLDFLTELDDELALVQAVLADSDGTQLMTLACHVSSVTGLNLSAAMVAARSILLRPPQC